MNGLSSFIRCICNKRPPKATYTDYYFDPKVMLFGTPYFDPKQVQNKISEHEFTKMREAMIREGGWWLIASKVLLVSLIMFAVTAFVFNITTLILKWSKNDAYDKIKISFGMRILIFVLPNLLLQCIWIFCVWKARNRIRDLFDWQNEKYYASRGVNWQTCNTLMYIHIKFWSSKVKGPAKC